MYWLGACAGRHAVDGISPLRAPKGVIVDDRVETYPVVGSDKASMRVQLVVPGSSPSEHMVGSHMQNISWTYEVRETAGHCRIQHATINLTSVITLPEWTPPRGVDAGLIAHWAQFRKAVAVHELGHRRFAYEGAGRIRRALERIPMQPCDQLASAARTAVEPLLAALDREQQRYDAKTVSGKTQGTIW